MLYVLELADIVENTEIGNFGLFGKLAANFEKNGFFLQQLGGGICRLYELSGILQRHRSPNYFLISRISKKFLI
jgi:hypothetical protein